MKRIDVNLLSESIAKLGVWITTIGALAFVWAGASNVGWIQKLLLVFVGVALILFGSLQQGGDNH